ncbi:MAG: hypothetical protein DRH37_05515 [Deltaproteobacteria bacterium]|nr:MAG: hypothetical protein DRH37_05515 [Deltaproteobacteria bacterium]
MSENPCHTTNRLLIAPGKRRIISNIPHRNTLDPQENYIAVWIETSQRLRVERYLRRDSGSIKRPDYPGNRRDMKS